MLVWHAKGDGIPLKGFSNAIVAGPARCAIVTRMLDGDSSGSYTFSVFGQMGLPLVGAEVPDIPTVQTAADKGVCIICTPSSA